MTSRLVLVLLASCLSSLLAQDPDIYERRELKCDRSVDVAIVGAGPSGTYSAYKMKDSGMSVELVEYSNRIGGRIYTYRMPEGLNRPLEMGAMKFYEKEHKIIERLIEELNLEKDDLPESFTNKDTRKYYLRGKLLSREDIKHGDIPFQLSAEEKANQANLIRFYLKKLTDFNESVSLEDQILDLKVKVNDDGRHLYKLRLDEALDLVATEEGKDFIRKTCFFEEIVKSNASAVNLFHGALSYDWETVKAKTIKGGMSKLPESLAKAFTDASKDNKITMNRKLESIIKGDSDTYHLVLRTTSTLESGMTVVNKSSEWLCAKKVILAIPQRALKELDYKPLRSERVRQAIDSVEMTPKSRIFMTFSQGPWWRRSDNKTQTNSTTLSVKSDTPNGRSYEWQAAGPSRQAVLVASSASHFKAQFQSMLNAESATMPGSAPGVHRVSESLKNELLKHAAESFGLDVQDVPEPVAAISHFWQDYPFGGSWSILKAGYHADDVRDTIQRPCMTDEVYIVGGDHTFIQNSRFVESALNSVDEVIDKYL